MDNQVEPAANTDISTLGGYRLPLKSHCRQIRIVKIHLLSPAPRKNGSKSIVNVQILRGIAALLVVFHHYIGTAAEKGFALAGLAGVALGNVGVDIFFVISGFIMEYISSAKRYSPGDRRAFILNRMQRILPLYWTLTIFGFCVFLMMQGAVNSKITTDQFLLSMLVLPDFSNGSIAYVIPLAWTLTYEFYFYAVFCLFLAARPQTRLIGMTAFFSMVVLLGELIPTANQYVAVFTNPIVLEFLAGCALAHLYRSGIRLDNVTCLVMVIGAAMVLTIIAKFGITESWLRIVLWGGPAALLVYAAVLKPETAYEKVKGYVSSAFEHIGNISYSLYLSHFFMLAVFVRLHAKISEQLSIGPVLAMVSFFALSIIGAQICYTLIENPSRSILKKWRTQQMLLPVKG